MSHGWIGSIELLHHFSYQFNAYFCSWNSYFMYTKEEKKAHIKRFWEGFDFYCENRPEWKGQKKKWILHDTNIGHVDLKFDVGKNFAAVALEINYRNPETRLKIFELTERYRPMLEEGFPNGLIWDFAYLRDNGQEVARIYCRTDGIDYHRVSDWQAIFTFFAENMYRLQNNFLDIQEYLADEVNAALRNDAF